MDYGSIVKAAWAADPTFVELCQTLWGPGITPEAIAKMGPDSADVHVPAPLTPKKKTLGAQLVGISGEIQDKRNAQKVIGTGARTAVTGTKKLEQTVFGKRSPTYEHTVPKADRSFTRDDKGRFATVGEVTYNSGVAATGIITGGLLANKAKNDMSSLGRLINELKSTSEGRAKLAQVIANRGTRAAAIAAGAGILGAAGGYHGKEAYEGIRDHVELERAHGAHLNNAVRTDDVESFVYGQPHHDLEVMTRGARRDAHTVAWTKGADGGTRFSTDSVEAQKDRRRHMLPADTFGKAAEELTGQLTQVDTDKRQVFGWASIVEKDGNPVVDLQGDYIGIDELEKSAYDYVHKSRVGGAMHRRVDADGNVISKKDAPYHAADLIESFVVTPEKIEKMGLPSSTPVGWWVGFKVNDDEVWQSVKSGDWKGFSIHGAGRRRSIGEVSDFDISGAELTR